MKGSKTITLKGEEVRLSFTVGALEDFQDYLKEAGVEGGFEDSLDEMKHLRKFLEILSEYGGDKVKADAFKFLDMSQIGNMVEVISSATESLGNVPKPPRGKPKGAK